MKRWTLRILLMLLLFGAAGAVTTVGVAWGLALWPNPRPWDLHLAARFIAKPDHEQVQQLSWVHATTWVSDDGYAPFPSMSPLRRFGVERIAFYDLPNYEVTWSGQMMPFVIRTRAGWPMMGTEGAIWYWGAKHAEVSYNADFIGGLPFQASVNYPLWGSAETRILPLRPILPGFLINTLFYAAIWFALIFGWRAHLRMICRWQGHCPLCKYDLRGDLDRGCPECGWNRSEATNDELRATNEEDPSS